ncbi:hypothetical protein DH2020_002803 [Rehmannia glutinosa]|uniref:Telomerase reverse transcriptase n=1 Tax=Rehmannia glutinosa TaxID=99300 RepID=A0ABR0XUU8_REHGL
MTRKRERVPEVLWRLFRNRARTLADTILALIPPPPAKGDECRCKGCRCLSCSGDEAMSFLVRPGDPSDYRKLLTGCFVVVSENAPPLPVFDPHCRWSQSEIVRRSIEMIMHEQSSASNLICCSYDKDFARLSQDKRTSAVVDTLTSSKWTLLLRRVGDALMMYLLKYTSIFLPLPRNKYDQISGFPISDLCFKISRRMQDSISQHHPHVYNGRRGKGSKELNQYQGNNYARILWVPSLLQTLLRLLQEMVNITFLEVIDTTVMRLLYEISEEAAMPAGSSCVSDEEFPYIKCDGSLKQNTVSSRKRTRQYRWQRQRKRKQLVVQGTSSLIPCGGNSCNCENLSRGPLNSVRTSSSQSHEDVLRIFYINVPEEAYPPQYLRFPAYPDILYTLKPNGSGAFELFNNIFRTFGIDKNPGIIPCLHSKNGCPVMSTCLSSYQDASRATGTGFQGHELGTILPMSRQEGDQLDGKWCHVANAKNHKMTHTDIEQVEPSKCYCPKKQVVSFIWAICRRIVPSPLLGEPSNWRILRKNISKFIQLRKFEKFSLKECIHRLKMSKFPLLSNKHCGDMHNGCTGLGITDTARHAIFQCWMFWFFAHLVSPLVQANFYVTESEHEKQEVLYYRKSTWKKLMREAECLKDDRYRLLDHASVGKILRNRSLGFSRARLCPKQIGFRMLTNLQAPSRMRVNPPPRNHSKPNLQRKSFCNHRVTYRFFKSVNNVLQDSHVVLKGLGTKEPEKLGSSVFDYNGVYRKLVPFLFLLKNGSTIMPSVFIVVSDVSKAFDSVNQDKLLSVMKDVILDDEYTLEKFTQVTCTKKSLKVRQQKTLAHQEIVTVSAKITSRLPVQAMDSIIFKKELSSQIRKEEIYLILKEHIMRNVVQLHNNFYLQRVGIPQGSVLSSLLCSYYYGHMERNVVFPFLEKATENLFIDDFLFISTSKKQASMFFSRLERGVRDYNCCMNKEKYGLNFNMNNGQECRSNRLHVGKDGVSYLRWSGLLVNCSTLEIQADYTRKANGVMLFPFPDVSTAQHKTTYLATQNYLAVPASFIILVILYAYFYAVDQWYLSSHLRSTLTVSCWGKVGRQLKAKLRCYLRPKCHPIFYDSTINSPGVVRLNIYQVFLLCAMKFTCYISNLSILPRFSPKFYINAIDPSLRYMNRLIKRKMYSFDVDTAFRPKYDVKKKEIIWLGLYAYSRVLKKKQSQYKKLLHLLRSKLKAYGKVKNMSSELRYAIDDAHSSVLWNIKY